MPERIGNLLRRIELARLLAGTGGKLADQVFVGIAQGIDVGGEFRQPFGDLGDGASVALRSSYFAELSAQLISEVGREGALEGLVFDVFEARLQGVEQFAILHAGQVGDAVPEVRRLDDVMHLAAHLLFKFRNVGRVVLIPSLQRRACPGF
jgi:hypothetical protein